MLHLLQATAVFGSDLSAPWSIVLLSGGIAMLVLGGHFLVESAVSLASRLGVAPFTIGMTIIAFGTSAPELALNVVAATSGASGASLAYGNVVGSNMANIGLVLAMACLIQPIHASRDVRQVHFWLLLGTELLLIGVAVVIGEVTRPAGILLVLGLPVCLIIWRALGNGQEAQEPSGTPRWGSLRATGTLLIGLLLLLSGAKVTEWNAVHLASLAGVSETVIGLTVVAIATSLPESFTAIVAARRGQSDLALGTVMGSNVLNILLVLGVTAIVHPVPVPDHYALLSLLPMLGFTVALATIFIRRPMGVIGGGHHLTRTWGSVALAAWVGVMIWTVVA